MTEHSRSARILHAVGTEMHDNPPRILAHTRAKFGKKRAENQRRAILLNKARKEGAHIPRG